MVAQSAPWLDGFAAKGSSGVTLFFVISGYCMYSAASATRAHGRPPWSFLLRRLRRIYPPFWASVLAVVLIPYLLETISSLKSGSFIWPLPAWTAFTAMDWGLLLSLFLVFLAPTSDLQSAFNPVNSVYWTLAIEVQFYLVVAIALSLGRYWRELLLFVSVLSLLPFVGDYIPSGAFLPFWPAFAIGLALRWIHEQGWHIEGLLGQKSLLAGTLCIGLTLVLATYIDTNSQMVFALTSAGFLYLIGCYEPVISKITSSRSVLGRLVGFPLHLALQTGACSYSLYLLHAKLYQLPAMFARQVFSDISLVNLVFIIGSTTFLCYVFYWVFERPFMSQSYRHRIQD